VTSIEVFADILCPFTHVGLRRLVAARAARGATCSLVIRAWPLEWINGRPIDAELAAHEIKGLERHVAPEVFAGFDPATFPRTSLPAFGLAAVAYEVGPSIGEAVSLRVREALFEEGRDVSDEAVLRAIGAEFGVQPVTPPVARAFAGRDWDRGRTRGVQGSPHFFADGGNWFCPTLSISKSDDDYEITIDEASQRAFYIAALESA
jgi:predicted DsbA family dithiol-disulfide isomerase